MDVDHPSVPNTAFMVRMTPSPVMYVSSFPPLIRSLQSLRSGWVDKNWLRYTTLPFSSSMRLPLWLRIGSALLVVTSSIFASQLMATIPVNEHAALVFLILWEERCLKLVTFALLLLARTIDVHERQKGLFSVWRAHFESRESIHEFWVMRDLFQFVSLGSTRRLMIPSSVHLLLLLLLLSILLLSLLLRFSFVWNASRSHGEAICCWDE